MTQVQRRTVQAPRAAIYRALLDPAAVARWRAPDDMRCEVHAFEPRVGGRFRVSLSYDDPAASGKSAGNVDSYRGRFAELIGDQRVVEVLEFETDEPSLQGEMTVTTTLADAGGGATEVTVAFDGLPVGVAPQDNATGTRMSLDKLAALVEATERG